jgi:putative FmdB family regulatory protein
VPTYSYRCTECDTAFDIQQSFLDDSLTVCPTCSGKLRKVFSAVGVSFTGSGFYQNDSRAAAPKPASSSGTASTPAAAPTPAPAAAAPAATTP